MGPNGAEPRQQPVAARDRLQQQAATELRWYALAVRSRCEKGVASELVRRGVEIFLPVRSERRLWRDRVKNVDVAFFPGYVFVRSHMYGVERFRIVDLSDVVCVVGKNGQRVGLPIPDHEIEAVRRIAEHADDAESCEIMRAGERVRVAAGPLRGIEGIIERVGRRQQIVCAITLLGRAVKTTVDADCLLVIEGP